MIKIDHWLGKLSKLGAGERKVPFNAMGTPSSIKFMDERCAELRIARGDLLLACLLSVHESYDGKQTKTDKKLEAIKSFREKTGQPPLQATGNLCPHCGGPGPLWLDRCPHCFKMKGAEKTPMTEPMR